MKKITMLFIYQMIFFSGYAQKIPSIIPFRNKNNLFGYCNPQKKNLIECKFTDAHPFVSGLAAVRGKVEELNTEGWFFINVKGQRVSNVYEEVKDAQEKCNVIRVKKNGLWYLIRSFDGKELVVPGYLYIREYYNGNAWAADATNRKWILINTKGERLTAPYDFCDDFHDRRSVAVVYMDGKTYYEILNTRGKVILPLTNRYDFINSYSNGLALVRTDSTYGFIRKNCKLKIGRFKSACKFSEEGIAIAVNEAGRTIAINKRMRTLFEIPFTIGYENCGYTSNLLPICNSQGCGLMNHLGLVVLPTLYDNISKPSSGIVAVKHEKWAFWSNGKFLTDFIFDENRVANYWTSQDYGYSFDSGLVRVFVDGKPGYLGINMVQYWE